MSRNEEREARLNRAVLGEKTSTGVAARPGDEVLKAIDFFKNCAEMGGDPTAKDIFISISDEERFHCDLLQAQYDSVTGSGFWLDGAEFQMDGKY